MSAFEQVGLMVSVGVPLYIKRDLQAWVVKACDLLSSAVKSNPVSLLRIQSQNLPVALIKRGQIVIIISDEMV